MKNSLDKRKKSHKSFSQTIMGADHTRETDSSAPHILLVEDHPLLQRLHGMLLEDLNYRVTIAGDGETALAYFEVEEFDLVLMDIDLPGISGIEATKKIRSKYPELTTPIVALTAFNNDIKLECLLSGIDDFAEKPIPRSKLEELLSFWILRTPDFLIH